MNKIVIGVAATVALLVVAFIGATVYVGSQLETELDNYEFALTQSSEVIVHRFEYTGGFLTGQLDYDLEWSPMPGTVWYDFAMIARETSDNALRTSGSADFRQGPWVGGANPFALGKMQAYMALPDAARRSLPQYPAETPMLTITSVLGFDGTVSINIDGVEYDGTYVFENSVENIMLTGLQADIELNSNLTHIQTDIELGRFSIVDARQEEFVFENFNLGFEYRFPGPTLDLNLTMGQIAFIFDSMQVEYRMENLNVTADTRKIDPGIWLGTSTMGMERLAMQLADISIEMLEIQGTNSAALNRDGNLDSTAQMRLGQLKVGDDELNNTTLQVSARSLSPQAYADFMAFTSQLNSGADDAPSVMDILNTALAAGPSFHIDRFAFSVVEPDDINTSLSFSYAGPLPANTGDPEEIMNGLAMQGEISVSIDAAKRLIALVLGNLDDSLSGAALDNAVEENYQQLLTMFNDTELFEVGADAITSSLRISNGEISFNGVSAFNLSDFSGFFGDDVGVSYGDLPEFPSVARFENVSLENGFTPDPYTVVVLAGGEASPYTTLGSDCFGSVNSVQPDVILNYSAGPDYGLYLYAESADDTTLIVLTPDRGWQCDDDSHGNYNPAVSIDSPLSGDYLIWVGNYDSGVVDALLGISEF